MVMPVRNTSAPDAGKAAQRLHRYLCRGRSQMRKERSLRQEISPPVTKLSEFRPEGIAGEGFHHPAG